MGGAGLGLARGRVGRVATRRPRARPIRSSMVLVRNVGPIVARTGGARGTGGVAFIEGTARR